MCGRSSLHDAPVSVLERFNLPPVIPGFRPRYNIAPTQEQWTLGLDEANKPEVVARRWGLIPAWADEPSIGNRLINARSESLDEKPAYKDAFRDRRCLILADGYYEWTTVGKSKVPMFFHIVDDKPFVMAGLWERWRSKAAFLETCTVVTTDAGSRAARYHHRMPALLTLDSAEEWLDPSTPPARLKSILAPYEGNDLECHEVSKLVNNPANDSPECMAPVAEPTVEKPSPKEEELRFFGF